MTPSEPSSELGVTAAPLQGMVVADFSRVLAGPFATMHLADLGASVVKVERPPLGDDTRQWGPPWNGTSSAYFDGVNRSKYSIALDLDDPVDLGRARQLMDRADIVVQNFRPGALDGYALDHISVRERNPAVIYCSISGFGSAGGAHLPGYDFVVQAAGGLMSITGDPAAEPHKVGVAVADVLTGKDAVIGILAALAARQRHGRGEHVEVDLLSSLLAGMANQVSTFLATGTSPRRMGNQHPSIAPYETLRCEDGLLAVACGNDRQFQRMTAELGCPEVAADQRFATNPARVCHRSAMVAVLEAALGHAPAAEWEARLVARGVPAARVADIGAGVDLAERLGLEPLLDVDGAGCRQVRHAVTYQYARTEAPSAPPAVDAHRDRVLRWLDGPDSVLPHAGQDGRRVGAG